MTRDGERLAELAERPVERRLRQALDARAESIDVRRLRPADPPGQQPGRLRMAGLRRLALPLAGLAAAAAAAGIGYLVLAPDPAPGPVLPATPPRITAPGPSSEHPASPTPQPSRSGTGSPGVDSSGNPAASPPAGRSVSPSAPVSPGPSGTVPPSASPSASPSGARGSVVTSSPPR
ncbi:hypothetical protein [Streptomyces avidinii]|uniref:Uncharacterized protein n=1 Tax=Streptomyces avidinii TaxID=1895 RepID=A0ABS4KYI1_STRAV|nr:hypothetical protein [Streptomyces avidinii]MBP2035101.1 hypothetical protein [Streptomyces avidinii]